MPRILACLAVLAALLGAAPAHAQGVVGRFILTDMNGRAVTDEAYAGKLRLMTFGYTSCPDVCPTILGTLASALDQLGPDKARVVALFVSVDPERDSPAQLKEYMTAFPGIVGLTGTPEQIQGTARNFKVRYEKQPAADGDPKAYAVDHSAFIYIMDGAGEFLARMPHASAPDRVAERVKSLLPAAPGKAR